MDRPPPLKGLAISGGFFFGFPQRRFCSKKKVLKIKSLDKVSKGSCLFGTNNSMRDKSIMYIQRIILGKSRFSLCNKSHHCAYIIYRVKTWFKKDMLFLILLLEMPLNINMRINMYSFCIQNST